MTTTANLSSLRTQFFDFLFGEEKGQVCIAIGNSNKTYFKQRFFKWPDERIEMGTWIENAANKYNVWFGVTLFNRPERSREFAIAGNRVWADLDEVDPFDLDPIPTVILESSPGRYQAFWSLSEEVPPDIAQDFSRRLAYHIGADKSGWDLEQLLRVPYTKNFKYSSPQPEIKVLRILTTTQPIDTFDSLPIPSEVAPGSEEIELNVPVPENPPDIGSILYHYHKILENPTVNTGKVFNELMNREPEDHEDWSARLWRLLNVCFEMGMSEEEVFTVGVSAKCNKYIRDNRPISYLWREVLKAADKHKKFNVAISNTATLKMPKLVDEDTVAEDSFVAEYKEWANVATDAPEQYHELSCFIALSSVISNGLALKLEYNENFRPNLWGLLLGESTLTRKTTCMNMAMDLITDLDPELILASDGSAEGLLSGLSGRPKRVSIFFKDEVSGFFDSINRKDYLAGFPETLTKLYDVPKVYPRMLRKETITVVEPYFIFFGGGIRDKVYSLITDDYILSGFIPRFLVVSSDNDITRIRRTGPPTEVSVGKKDELVNRLIDLKERYSAQVPAKVGLQTVYLDTRIDCRLTDEAWSFFGDVEEKMVQSAIDSPWQALALPTLSRLSFSMLKMGMLIAASRRPPTDSNTLPVELSDLKQAAYYIQKWGQFSLDLVMASGKSTGEKVLDKALSYIRDSPNGIVQSQLMQRFHLTSKEMREIRDTLADRGLVEITQQGRGYNIKAMNY